MTSLYDILKANRLGMDSDPWIAILGEAWKASEEDFKEYTGLVPYTFIANGQPLLDWYIKGNTVQNGTPSPSNPVEVNGVGVRTENLFDASIYTKSNVYKSGCTVSVTGGNLTITATSSDPYVGEIYSSGTLVNPVTRDALIEILPNTTYTISTRQNKCYITICDASFYSVFAQKMPVTSEYTSFSFTTPNNAKYALFRFGNENLSVGQSYTFDNIMLTKGSTAKSYEPYGYKIPISSGGVTTNIYLGSTQTVRWIKKIVLTGEENWTEQESGDYKFFQFILADYGVSGSGYCSHYTYATIGISTTNVGFGITSNGRGLRFRPNNVSTMSLEDFKSYLSTQYANGTPVTVWYVLQTAETAAVNEPLMKIGDYADTLIAVQAGVEIPTDRGRNTIDIDTDVKPSEFYMKWKER